MKVLCFKRCASRCSSVVNDYTEDEFDFIERVNKEIKQNEFNVKSIQCFRHNDYKGIDEIIVVYE